MIILIYPKIIKQCSLQKVTKNKFDWNANLSDKRELFPCERDDERDRLLLRFACDEERERDRRLDDAVRERLADLVRLLWSRLGCEDADELFPSLLDELLTEPDRLVEPELLLLPPLLLALSPLLLELDEDCSINNFVYNLSIILKF
jgi:hypothetical protein